MKKAITLVLMAALMLSLAACSSGGDGKAEAVTKDNLKVGVVHIMDLGDQGYTYNHDQGAKKMIAELGLREDQYIPKFNINDTDVAATNAAINELVNEGCQIIFATSFSYGTQVVEAAKAQPGVVFCHATGSDAHFNDLTNLHNYFAKIHQARYLAGIAAGLKTENNHLGYVAAFPYAEVISGYTAFFLGAKSVNPDVYMDVMYADTWGDALKEREIAEALLNRGCDVISQHSDSVSPALAAEAAGKWHVGYNNDMAPAAPNASLISARIDWGIYMTYAVKALLEGQTISVDWGEGLETGAAYLSPLNTAIAAPGTQEAIDAAAARIISGDLKIFSGALKDASGNPAVITNWDGSEVLFTFENENSVFLESDEISAPAFNAIIDGINIVS
ncbi:MAG: BMP family ABC transporter substrate-binding protein [Clostridiales bacterium]|jgi:basic membrane protein A|nr:BMP family ABC transporter substrate-binding protein [Clostridiales bacterium]